MEVPLLFETLLMPLLAEVKVRLRAGTLRVLHERFLTTRVRNVLGRFLNQTDHVRRSGSTLVACPVAEQELAALMGTVTIRHVKGDATYLGVPIQPEDIAFASTHRNAHNVVVCLAPTADDATITRYGRELRRHPPLSTAN